MITTPTSHYTRYSRPPFSSLLFADKEVSANPTYGGGGKDRTFDSFSSCRTIYREIGNHFGRYGRRLYELFRGIDNNEVVPDRPTKSISAASNERRRRVQNKLRAHGNLLLVGMFSGEKGAYRCAESQH